MSDLIDVYEPGERVWTMNKAGQPRVWLVTPSGALVEQGDRDE